MSLGFKVWNRWSRDKLSTVLLFDLYVETSEPFCSKLALSFSEASRQETIYLVSYEQSKFEVQPGELDYPIDDCPLTIILQKRGLGETTWTTLS